MDFSKINDKIEFGLSFLLTKAYEVHKFVSGEVYMIKIRLHMKFMRFETYVKNKLLCKNGFHKVYSKGWKSTNNKGETLETNYIGCYNCDYLFFAKKEDKDMYKRLKDQKKSRHENFVKMIMNSKPLVFKMDNKGIPVEVTNEEN